MTTATPLHETVDWEGMTPCHLGCKCGYQWTGCAKVFYSPFSIVSKDPCPGCGSHDGLHRVTLPADEVVLTRDSTGKIVRVPPPKKT